MSQAPPEANNILNPGTANHHYPPQLAQNQAPAPIVSHFIDGSGPIFSMYLERAKEVDEKMAENWKADADGILIFTGLFSAAVASLISVSIQDVRQNPQDTSNFYLANIYQTIADPNRPNISTPSSLPGPPPFTPPNYAVWVNGLWFLSLLISLTCALLATLLQQWARRYLKAIQPRYSLHKRARIRAFFAEGVEKTFLPLAVESLPTLLHVSLFLFFAGLVVFLCNVNLTIYKMALSWVGICATLYGCITLVSIFRRDSPYYTPLTPLALLIYIVILRVYLFIRFLFRTCFIFLPWACNGHCNCSLILKVLWEMLLLILKGRPSDDPRLPWPIRVLNSTFMTAEEIALTSSPEIDARAFMWTFDSLDEDHELERFFSSLPDFRSSKVVDDPLPSLTQEEKKKISETLIRFLSHTLLSDFLPEAVKSQRAIMCAKALDLAEFSQDSGFYLHQAIFDALYKGSQITNFGPNADDSRTEQIIFTEQTIFIQAIITEIAARPGQHNDYWFRHVAPNALGIPETVLREYAANGDSLSLAILINVTRQQFTNFRNPSWPSIYFQYVLEAVSEFNVQDTSPELQHEFCTLWNHIVFEAQNDNEQKIALHILRPLRKAYITLHQDTESAPIRFSADTGSKDSILHNPTSYPSCTVAGHFHGGLPSASFSLTAQHNSTAPVPPSLASPRVPSSSISAPLHVFESSTDVSSLDIVDNFQPVQTIVDGLRLPIAPASAIRDFNASLITIPHPTPESSTSAAPLSSSPPADPVILPYNAGLSLFTPSRSSNRPSSASLNPAPGNMLPTESHRSIIVSTAPSATPGMTFAPDGIVSADDDTNPFRLRKKKDTLGRPLENRAIHANVLAAPDPQLQDLSMLTNDSDEVVAGPSRELTVECTGNHPSHFKYDVV